MVRFELTASSLSGRHSNRTELHRYMGVIGFAPMIFRLSGECLN